jgi:hypothetical protein
MSDKNRSGAKGHESAQAEGLRNKESFTSKDMYKPQDKTQRMPKGSDRA